ncbi:elongation factor Ts, mitochondrial [Clostridium tepidiprofundi DSM 19306]|uniref:Elongation factor Ts, mitochondrial n=1 Tax=Clostridium tepidiprofundi DSM 19306 TaxID=1121338 RepID=A0A151B4F7_9CLOT|nr:DUF4342 domain-containing protein [Clostridium tepidiprofundi]KYH34537.1 elongation factor Ts, mitochondrial [Clostridium tepidiprofundi DSM 19306]
MSDITLEKIDIIRERVNVSYAEAKEALEASNGDVVDALIYIEEKSNRNDEKIYEEFHTTQGEFKQWLKDLVRKGNVSRIKIKKDDRVLIDIPVNAGLAAGILTLIYPQLLALGILTAVVTKITVEITRKDGTVEVVNTIIKNAVDDIKEKVNDLKNEVEHKANNKESEDGKEKFYQYSVKFDDVEEEEYKENVNKDKTNNESDIDNE